MKFKRMLLFSIIGFLILVLSVFALAATELSVYPSQKDVTKDEIFVISVSIGTTEDVVAAQFDINFNPLVINATDLIEGGFLTKDGDFLLVDSLEINNTLGKIEILLMKDDTFTGVSGSGSIVNITFKALVKNGVSDIALEDVIIVDTAPSAIDAVINNGTVNVITIEPIVINEIMQNPAAVSDTNGEYLELYNPNAYDIDIDGWTIRDDGSDNHLIDNGAPLIINSGGYLVLCRNDNILENGNFSCDYEYSSLTLGNADDEIILLNEGGFEVDRVKYDNGATFPDPTGASMELKDPSLDNNIGSNWMESTAAFGDGDKGTPGEINSLDSDGDDIGDLIDNCPLYYNPDPQDTDGDGVGNLCDNCEYEFNPNQTDDDNDYIGNMCDNCPNNFGTDFDGGCYYFIEIDADEIETMDEIANYIEENGKIADKSSHITQKIPTHILIGYIPEEVIPDLLTHDKISRITNEEVEPLLYPEAEYGVNYWNSKVNGSLDDLTQIGPEPEPPVGDMEDEESQPGGFGILAGPKPPLPYETSEYMIGSVAVIVVFVESNGSIDTETEDWSNAQKQAAYSEIASALNWWANKNSSAQLSFTTFTYTAETSYEPINRPSDDECLWIHESMDFLSSHLGYTNGIGCFGKVYALNNHIRNSWRRDWVFTIFMVDSSHDGDNKFEADSDGKKRFAYVPFINAPYTVITSSADEYESNHVDAVAAHEMGHIFGAADQYDGAWSCNESSDCSLPFGFLNVENQNCVHNCLLDEPSLMRSQISPYRKNKLDVYAQGQIGWNDTDGDGIFDPVDTIPSLTITSSYHLGCIGDSRAAFVGFADDTQNHITDVVYLVDHTDWNNPNGSAFVDDGAFDESYENFTLTTDPLSDGTHTVRIKAINSVNQESSVHVFTVYIDNTPPTKVTNLQSISHTILAWSNDDTIAVTWTAATDANYGFCGLDGYSIVWDTSSVTVPDITKDIGTIAGAASPVLADGNNHYFHIRAVDKGGNWGSAEHIGPFYIDTTQPNSPTYNSAENQWFKNNPTLDIDFSDSLALNDVYHRIDNGSWNSIATNVAGNSYTTNWQPADWSSLSEGWHYIYFNVSDDAGNYYVTPNQNAAFKYGKDVSAPNTTDNAPAAWPIPPVTVNLTATDLYSGVNATYYCVDQNDTCNASTEGNSVVIKNAGIHYVRYYSTDNIGNIENIKSAEVKIGLMWLINLKPGWNLISIPLILEDNSTDWLCSEVECSHIFAHSQGEWLYYDPAMAANTLNEIDENLGYWIKVDDEQILTIEGTEFSYPVNIPLKQGWNLIGYPSLNAGLINETLKDVDYSVVYAYDGLWLSYTPNKAFNSLETMNAGYGYWLYSNEDIILTID